MKYLISSTALAVVLAVGTAAPAAAQAQTTVKIGVMSDMSSLYSDIGGPGSTAAAQLAIADFTANNKDIKGELVSAAHQNKPDIRSDAVQQGYHLHKGDPRTDRPNPPAAPGRG